MRGSVLALLVSLLIILPGCGVEQRTTSDTISEEVIYHSDTLAEDCCLCGDGLKDMLLLYQEQNNVALISLNTFEIKLIEINRYDVTGQLIEENVGIASFVGSGSIDGGFSAILMSDYDRKYASGSVEFFNDKTLDIDKVASFLCTKCMNEVLPKDISQCFGVGIINLNTKKLCLFEKTPGEFELGDFYCDYDFEGQENSDPCWMYLSISYCKYDTK